MIEENTNPLAILVSLVTNERVRDELDLAGPQMANLKENVDGLKEDFKRRIQELQKKSDSEKKKLRPELMDNMTTELDGLLPKIMRPDQFERYKQLRFQKEGLSAFTDSALRNALGFSEEQKKKLLALLPPAMKTVRAANRNGADAHGRPVKEVEQREVAKITELMTETQLAKWEELLGDEFDFGEEPVSGVQSNGPQGPGSKGPGVTAPGTP